MSAMFREPKSDLGGELEAAEVPESFIRMLNAALKSPLLVVPKPFETWMIDKVASSGFDLPVSQIVGFQQYTVQSATEVQTTETTGSTTFTDLATVGPQLTGLPDGNYLFHFGGLMKTTGAATFAQMGLKVNATEAVSGEDAEVQGTVFVSASRALVKRLANSGNNTVTARYKVDAASTGSFATRWLIAQRISA